MAVVTGVSGAWMIDRFSCCNGVVMAAVAGASHAVVVHDNCGPIIGDVAIVTGVGSRNMCR